MHPEKLGIEPCDLESLQQSQSTQTSCDTLDTDQKSFSKTKLPLPNDVSKSDKGSVTVFEFCQILQDPESPRDVTVIKDTITEETKPHSSNSQDFASPANRYKYCREVIKPYLKQSLDCPESEEELLKNVFDSLSEDFPDYQPCFEIPEEDKKKSDTNNSTQTNNSRNSSVIKVDACTSYSSMDEHKDTKCIPKSKSTEDVPPKGPTPEDKYKEDCESPPKPKCAKKKKCSPKPSISTCCEKEPTIGITGKKPSYFLTERCKDENTIPVPRNDPDDTITPNQKTISTIKLAVEDFVCKVYNSTKDAVTLITTESAKQIDKMKKSETSNTESSSFWGENKSSETATTFNFFRKVDSTDSEDRGSGSKPELPSVSEMFSNIMEKVDSTLSMIGERINIEIPEGFKPSKYSNSSSVYDKPTPTKKVSNIYIPEPEPVPVPNSVFATIKDKICSIFYDDHKQATDATLKSQKSDTQMSQESDTQILLPKSSSSSSIKKDEDESNDCLVDRVIE